MGIACPACNKKDVSGDTCPRCDCDLSALKKILSAAEYYFQSGLRFFSQGKGYKALHCSELSWSLKNNARTAKLAFASSLMCKKYRQTTKWYKRIKMW